MCWWKTKSNSDDKLVYVSQAGSSGQVSFVTRTQPSPSAEAFEVECYQKLHEKKLAGAKRDSSGILKLKSKKSPIKIQQSNKSIISKNSRKKPGSSLASVKEKKKQQLKHPTGKDELLSDKPSPGGLKKNKVPPKEFTIKARTDNTGEASTSKGRVKLANKSEKSPEESGESGCKTMQNKKAKLKDEQESVLSIMKESGPKAMQNRKAKLKDEQQSDVSIMKDKSHSSVDIEDDNRVKVYVNDSRLFSRIYPIEHLENWGNKKSKEDMEDSSEPKLIKTLRFWKKEKE